ncbi:MAG: hypothetical protein M1818_004150 [Claussenomyces sp. TS43310]|nr:MAG: hypothetical protein M1818_004150 [Claussenomyces sp. TS43310]
MTPPARATRGFTTTIYVALATRHDAQHQLQPRSAAAAATIGPNDAPSPTSLPSGLAPPHLASAISLLQLRSPSLPSRPHAAAAAADQAGGERLRLPVTAVELCSLLISLLILILLVVWLGILCVELAARILLARLGQSDGGSSAGGGRSSNASRHLRALAMGGDPRQISRESALDVEGRWRREGVAEEEHDGGHEALQGEAGPRGKGLRSGGRATSVSGWGEEDKEGLFVPVGSARRRSLFEKGIENVDD